MQRAYYTLLRVAIRTVLRVYGRLWHRLHVEGSERLPKRGPALILVTHASMLDVPMLIAADPWGNVMTLVKASLFRIPVVRSVLRSWGSIPVERGGRDTAGIRAVLDALSRGRLVGIAAEGTRSRTGALQQVNPVLARLACHSGAPVVPVAVVGSFAALPPGSWFPRPTQIVVRVGVPFLLDRDTPVEEARARIRAALAAAIEPAPRTDAT